MQEKGTDPIAEVKAKHTARSQVLKAKSIFSAAILEALEDREDIEIPDPIPFSGIRLPKIDKSSIKYRSKMNLPDIFQKALTSLTQEELKVFILAVACGLRRGEIDVLLWSQIDFKQKLIEMQKTIYTSLKSDHSANPIYLEDQVFNLLKEWHAKASGEFVVEGNEFSKIKKTYRGYRLNKMLRRVTSWLREQGISAQKPLHELRKEAGRLVVEEYGIYAAKEFLRHGDIQTTAQHYADDTRRITTGIGKLLDAES